MMASIIALLSSSAIAIEAADVEAALVVDVEDNIIFW
jgi:hypothetical protein